MRIHLAEYELVAELSEAGISEAELTELALSADSDVPLGADAVPLAVYLAQSASLLPQWYMPPTTARCGSRWRTPVILAIIVAFLLIDAWGLCSTYGQIVLA